MRLISLNPINSTSVVKVPLGQTQAFHVSGSYQQLDVDDGNTYIDVSYNGQVGNASMDQIRHTFQAVVILRCPGVYTVKARLHTQHWIDRQPNPRWIYSTTSSDPLVITVEDSEPDPQYTIVCRCVDSGNRPLVGFQIEAFDQDPGSPDDKLGATMVTDTQGLVEFKFRKSTFSKFPGERNPDVYFRVSKGGTTFSYKLPGERSIRGVMRNFQFRSTPVVVYLPDARGFVVQGAIYDKWLSLGAENGLLGQPTCDEQTTPGGRGKFNHFDGGSIYWTPEWGAYEVHGLIRQKWIELNWEQGFLGFPVSDELDLPDAPASSKYSLFEHGIITWTAGDANAVAGPHHYERIYASVRAQILSRFFAIGTSGRRNLVSLWNRLKKDPTEEYDRWNIERNEGENPFLYGSMLPIALAVEHNAGNAESGRALKAYLETLESLFTWREPGNESTSRLPLRWDAGLPTGDVKYSEFDTDFDPVSRKLHRYARRAPVTLEKLLGPTAGDRYATVPLADKNIDNDEHRTSGSTPHGRLYRSRELSMDELTGLVTTYWIVNKLSRSPSLTSTVKRQAGYLGNYLANHAYMLVRPRGGVAWRGSMGLLPALEYPFARALGEAAGADFTSRTNFEGAMKHAGYWRNLEGVIVSGHALGWTTAVALSAIGGPVAASLGITFAEVEKLVANQIISPGTIGATIKILQNPGCFDMAEGETGQACWAYLFSEARKKGILYRDLAIGQALFAPFRDFSVSFHSWIGLTGIDDPLIRNTFNAWFAIRGAHPELEPKSQGSRTLFAAGVATLVQNSPDIEKLLVARLEQAIVELFRSSYFSPMFPIEAADDAFNEYCMLGHGFYEADPRKPYSPLDFLGATALAFWHAKRREDERNSVTTERFPLPLAKSSFAYWPEVFVPGDIYNKLVQDKFPIDASLGSPKPVGNRLFGSPPVPRNLKPPRTSGTPADHLVCNLPISVHASYSGDLATGITLFPGHEIQIEATGSIWGGGTFDPTNGPDGLARPVDDPEWPLHTGIDPDANVNCLVGRLNGYFRIGRKLPRTRWKYHEERALFLRINNAIPGQGSGQFNVSIKIWAPQGDLDSTRVFHHINLLQEGGVLRTSDPADLIEVLVVEQVCASDKVEFELKTPENKTFRKELILIPSPATGAGSSTLSTQGSKHSDIKEYTISQLQGAMLIFNKERLFIMPTMWILSVNIPDLLPGSRVTFSWVYD